MPQEKVGGELQDCTLESTLCAVLFNCMGLLHELLKDKQNQELVKK